MLTHISDWHSRRKRRIQRDKIHNCSIYVVDDFCLALPRVSNSACFPEEEILKTLSTSMPEADAIGASVLSALDYAEYANKLPVTKDIRARSADFLDGMERYRKSIGVGQRRFESRMQTVSITRKDGEIHFSKYNRAYGRFAFEGSKLPDDELAIASTATKA